MARDEDSAVETEISEREPEVEIARPRAEIARAPLLRRLTRSLAPRGGEVIDQAAVGEASRVRAPREWPSAYWLSFIFLVAIPAFAVSLYFAIWASDQFVAEARFAVTSAKVDTVADKIKSAISVSGLPTASSQDAYIIAAYIRSRSIVDDLSKEIDLRAAFRRPEADFWARLRDNASAEELTDYWRSMVGVYVDPTSGIVTVTVRAFRAEDALAISNAVVKVSEALANNVSARSRADTMKQAEGEVALAETRVLATLADLRAFRDKSGIIDPVSQAGSTGGLLTSLLAQRIKLQNDYFVSSRAMSPQAPTVQSLKSRLDGLDQQIADLKSKLTGSASGATIAGLLPKYEELQLRNQFAEKLYTFAQESLERARERAMAQSIYVSVFVPPALPQDAKFPERISLSLIFAASLLVLWGIGALTGAAIEDHRI